MKKKLLIGLASLVVLITMIAITTAPAPEPAPAEFEVSNLDVNPEEVKPGETVTIAVDVQNVGEEQGTHELELTIDGLVEQSENVTLDGGGTTSVSFFVQKEIEGPYTLESGGLTGAFLVVKPEPTPTPVGGVLSGEVVWTPTESPYTLTSHILVPQGSRLIIEPGTQVGLHDRSIQVEGTLQVLGISNQPVMITGHANTDYAKVIFKASSVGWDESTQSGSIIRNAIIEGQSYAGGIIQVDGSSPKIIDSTLVNANPSGIVIDMHGSSQIIANTISGYHGVYFRGSGSPRIVGNRIEGHNASQGISLGLARATTSHVRIEGNLITGFEYGVLIHAIDEHHRIDLISNHITGNQIGILASCFEPSPPPQLHVTTNAIYDNSWNARLENEQGRAFDIDVTNNWWGPMDSAAVNARLYHHPHDFRLGHIVYEPFLPELPEAVPLP